MKYCWSLWHWAQVVDDRPAKRRWSIHYYYTTLDQWVPWWRGSCFTLNHLIKQIYRWNIFFLEDKIDGNRREKVWILPTKNWNPESVRSLRMNSIPEKEVNKQAASLIGWMYSFVRSCFSAIWAIIINVSVAATLEKEGGNTVTNYQVLGVLYI